MHCFFPFSFRQCTSAALLLSPSPNLTSNLAFLNLSPTSKAYLEPALQPSVMSNWDRRAGFLGTRGNGMEKGGLALEFHSVVSENSIGLGIAL